MRGAGGDRSGRAEGGILSPSHPFSLGWENTLPAHNRTMIPAPAHNRILAPPPRCSPHCTRGAGAGWVVPHTTHILAVRTRPISGCTTYGVTWARVLDRSSCASPGWVKQVKRVKLRPGPVRTWFDRSSCASPGWVKEVKEVKPISGPVRMWVSHRSWWKTRRDVG